MEKIYLLFILVLSTTLAKAQNQIIDGSLFLGLNGGAVTGIGYKLIFGGVAVNSDEMSIYRFNREMNVSDLRVNIGDDYGSGDDRFLIGTNNWKDGKYYVHMVVGADGKVGIGTEILGAERLAVNGRIRAKEIKVETANWPDYVFKPDYKLPSLKETEAQIKANGHLPGMPSAKDVETNGLALGEMLKLQQKKIEELTLYLIQQNQEILKLKKLIIKNEKNNH